MTKERARQILDTWLSDVKIIKLPIFDEVIFTENYDNEVTDWTWRGLIKIAYNLKDND